MVRWRRLYRSDHLGDLTQDDVAALSGLGLGRVLDFRGQAERTPKPCRLPGVAVHALSIEPTVVQGMQELHAAGGELTPQRTAELMEQTYRDFVRRSSARYAELFSHLLQDDAPLVFHCTAGKDRTGLAAALILSALGVAPADVMQDFLLTNALYRMPEAAAASAFASQDVMKVLWSVQPAFLQAALQAVDADYGGMDRFLEQALGLGTPQRQRLQQLYLEP